MSAAIAFHFVCMKFYEGLFVFWWPTGFYEKNDLQRTTTATIMLNTTESNAIVATTAQRNATQSNNECHFDCAPFHFYYFFFDVIIMMHSFLSKCDFLAIPIENSRHSISLEFQLRVNYVT